MAMELATNYQNQLVAVDQKHLITSTRIVIIKGVYTIYIEIVNVSCLRSSAGLICLNLHRCCPSYIFLTMLNAFQLEYGNIRTLVSTFSCSWFR